MVEAALIENVLSVLFDVLKSKVISGPEKRGSFDFIVKDKDDKKIAIEVKARNPSYSTIVNLKNQIKKEKVDEFYLILPYEPTKSELNRFNYIFSDQKIKSVLLGISDFLSLQSLDIDINDDLGLSLKNLQLAAITSKLENYKAKDIGLHDSDEDQLNKLLKNFDSARKGTINISELKLSLRRQFPDNIIASLENSSEEIEKSLNLGKKYDNAVIVLSDIKSFSEIVTASDPDELNETMSKFYTNARELVFKYNGILDKFIGDAVLAIFNYPENHKTAFENAIKFCIELIAMTTRVLTDFQKKLDQEITTGTRIGIATGPIYSLNISTDGYEITFIGDKINFAARLEKNCEVDGVLMSNRFYNKLKESSDLSIELKAKEKQIPPENAKGQTGITKAWQANYSHLKKVFISP